MALKTYIGDGEGVTLVVAGHEIGFVAKDEAIVVPDELAELVTWPEALWADGTPAKDEK